MKKESLVCMHATDTMPPPQSTDRPKHAHTEAHLEHAVEQAGVKVCGCNDVPDRDDGVAAEDEKYEEDYKGQEAQEVCARAPQRPLVILSAQRGEQAK